MVSMSCLMVHWLSRLARKNVLPVGASLLEFGPQDMTTSRATIEAVARRHHGEGIARQFLEKIFEGESARRDFQRDFYSIFGIRFYTALDAFDDRAELKYDLNDPIEIARQYSIVTNFGTAEHVFNIGHVFEHAHRFLEPGGILLNCVPAFGDINHGFYNVHPLVYMKLAEANGYAVEDFQYIDNITTRSELAETRPGEEFAFDELPVKMADMKVLKDFQRKISVLFILNSQSHETEIFGITHPSIVMDYCFVALRKLRAAEFVVPNQYSLDVPAH
jgi:SAM-dependent methyltransferase